MYYNQESELGLCIEFGPVRVDSVRWGPCAGSRRHGLLTGLLVIACTATFRSPLVLASCPARPALRPAMANAMQLAVIEGITCPCSICSCSRKAAGSLSSGKCRMQMRVIGPFLAELASCTDSFIPHEGTVDPLGRAMFVCSG